MHLIKLYKHNIRKEVIVDSSLKFSVSDLDPHSIGRPDPGGLKRDKMKKKRSKKSDN
jgi:hypothetical protein